jgi:hypothetical protein
MPGKYRHFFFSRVSTQILGPTQTFIQWAWVSHSLGVKWPGRAGDHSVPPSAEVEHVELFFRSRTRLHVTVRY